MNKIVCLENSISEIFRTYCYTCITVKAHKSNKLSLVARQLHVYVHVIVYTFYTISGSINLLSFGGEIQIGDQLRQIFIVGNQLS